jgi:Response regulator containing a CheY-like receiver domain and an HTH DNA-binding domain
MHSSSLSLPQNMATRIHGHPWLRGLEVFGIPFLCYGSDARRSFVSPAATALLAQELTGPALGRQADRAVLAELADRRRRFQIGQFTLAREIAGPGNMTLAVHIVRPVVEDICAIVVMRVRVEAPTPATSLPGLSPRESAVAQLICAGLGTKQIAVRLGISAHTARHHTERLFAKLGVHSRAGVVALCAGTLSIPSATKPSPNPEST